MLKLMLVSVFLIGATTLAIADNDKLPAGAISTAQITSQLEAHGFKVSKIEVDDGAYKVKGVSASGQKQKLKVNPMTGAVSSTENDD